MAWDKTRPVPYRRLVREWAIYAGIMLVLFGLFLRNSTTISGLILGLAVSFPLWIGFSWVLAKLGYSRKSYSQLRAERAERTAAAASNSAGASTTSDGRARPVPTRRTSTGPSNRPSSKPARKRK